MPPWFMGIENPEDIYLNTVVVPKPVCDSEGMMALLAGGVRPSHEIFLRGNP